MRYEMEKETDKIIQEAVQRYHWIEKRKARKRWVVALVGVQVGHFRCKTWFALRATTSACVLALVV
jgi:hypothetical protein